MSAVLETPVEKRTPPRWPVVATVTAPQRAETLVENGLLDREPVVESQIELAIRRGRRPLSIFATVRPAPSRYLGPSTTLLYALCREPFARGPPLRSNAKRSLLDPRHANVGFVYGEIGEGSGCIGRIYYWYDPSGMHEASCDDELRAQHPELSAEEWRRVFNAAFRRGETEFVAGHWRIRAFAWAAAGIYVVWSRLGQLSLKGGPSCDTQPRQPRGKPSDPSGNGQSEPARRSSSA